MILGADDDLEGKNELNHLPDLWAVQVRLSDEGVFKHNGKPTKVDHFGSR